MQGFMTIPTNTLSECLFTSEPVDANTTVVDSVLKRHRILRETRASQTTKTAIRVCQAFEEKLGQGRYTEEQIRMRFTLQEPGW